MSIHYNPGHEPTEDDLKAYNIQTLKTELAQTDYIIIKIAEAEALGDHDEAERIRTEHADIIAKRAKLRNGINAIKDKWEHRS